MAQSYKLASYQSAQGPRAGVVVGEDVFDAADLTGKPGYATVLAILDDWNSADDALAAAAMQTAGKKAVGKLGQSKLLPPVLWPSAIYCAGANYTDHMLEMANVMKGKPEPDPHSQGLKPWHFIKTSRSVAAPDETVKLPAYSQKVDWEAELGAVIGRTTKNISLEQALSCVAGYTVANDLSARDVMKRAPVPDASPFKFDWLSQKCFDQACPIGPWIVPARDVPDPQKLGIKLWVNDVIKQDSHTSQMIFTLAEQIAHLSTRMTLHPGDVVLTGTPAGVGMARGEFLKAGDVVKIWVEGVGTLSNRMA
jgi:2-keto-4-pentenoate hydratase/2-oxohepta-3-ene-1,7-dioic acid hydratase in catechol pathway